MDQSGCKSAVDASVWTGEVAGSIPAAQTKVCRKCNIEKHVDAFHRSSTRGRQAYCKVCRKIVDNQFYRRDPDKRRQLAQNHRAATRALNQDLKNAPCADCGQVFHFAAMQWDHLPGTEKINEVSNLVGNGRTRQFLAEIAKCELVCANCHAVRTYNRLHHPDQ